MRRWLGAVRLGGTWCVLVAHAVSFPVLAPSLGLRALTHLALGSRALRAARETVAST